jgi:cytochrome c biogenesis protein CcdA
LLGRAPHFSIANPIDMVRETGVRALFLYGVGFGIASLSCTLPIFLMVVGGALSAGNLVQGLVPFIGYSGGMALVVVGLTLATALLKGALVQQMRWVSPYVGRLSGLLLVAAGVYIVYFQTRFGLFGAWSM